MNSQNTNLLYLLQYNTQYPLPTIYETKAYKEELRSFLNYNAHNEELIPIDEEAIAPTPKLKNLDSKEISIVNYKNEMIKFIPIHNSLEFDESEKVAFLINGEQITCVKMNENGLFVEHISNRPSLEQIKVYYYDLAAVEEIRKSLSLNQILDVAGLGNSCDINIESDMFFKFKQYFNYTDSDYRYAYNWSRKLEIYKKGDLVQEQVIDYNSNITMYAAFYEAMINQGYYFKQIEKQKKARQKKRRDNIQ